MVEARITTKRFSSGRYALCATAIVLCFSVLIWKAWHLQTVVSKNLAEWGSRYQQRVHRINAKRGTITDRNGQPLAVSARIYSVGVDPRFFAHAPKEDIIQAARILDIPTSEITALREKYQRSSFFYLRRHISPAKYRALIKLKLPGVIKIEEHKRYYPERESFANVVGITNLDDKGLEGIELAYDDWLSGSPGEQRFVRDNRGRVIEDLGVITHPDPGLDLRLTLDKRLQHFAYNELLRVVDHQQAGAGSMVIVDATNGEVLAMVNVPSLNPNNRQRVDFNKMRNRGAVDVFEPGSTIKPLTIAAALESKRYSLDTELNIGSGVLRIDDFTISDVSTKGKLSVADILKYSSNVGAGKIAMDLGSDSIWGNLNRFGFGSITHSGFPGESAGILKDSLNWPAAVTATHGYGYGLSTTLLQLARAYAILASFGEDRRLTFYAHRQQYHRQVISAEVAKQVMSILGDIVQDGTGKGAQINGYSVGGKTGTTRKTSESGGYSEDRYHALFVGIAPLDKPRLVCAIMIDDPQKEYYGGIVAAPLYAKVISVALRLLGIPADQLVSHDRYSDT